MEIRKLGKIASIQYGYPLNSKLFSKTGKIRVIRIRDIRGKLEPTYYNGHYKNDYEINNGDILVGMDGEFNCIIWDGGKAVLNQRMAKIMPEPSVVDKLYLFYLLKTKLKLIENQIIGSTVKHLLDFHLRGIEIPLPSLDTQKRIGLILNKGEKLRLIREKSNHLTNKIIQSVFLKMVGRKSPENRIADVVEFVSSGATPLGGGKIYLPEGIVFIRSQNVHMNELRLDNVAHISEDVHKQMSRTWVKNGDVLLNITGASLGRVAVYRGPNDRANVNQHVCILRVKKAKALPEFVSYYLSLPNMQNEIWTIQAGASRQALNFKQVKSLKIYIAPIDEQKKFASFVSKIQTLKEKQSRSTLEMNELFNSLTQKAFRGELFA